MGDKAPVNTAVAVGQALCGLVHDVSNVVQTVLLRAEVTMATEEPGEEVCATFEKIMADSKHSVDVLRYLLEYSRAQVQEMPQVDVSKVIQSAVEELVATTELSGALEFKGATQPLVTHADEAQLRELIVILVEELLRDSDSDSATGVEVTLDAAAAKPAGTDSPYHWTTGMEGIRLTVTREGAGAPLDIEDGSTELPTSLDEPLKVLQLLRAKGIIRQHRGQFRVVEAVDDTSQKLSLEIFLPFQGD